MAKIPQATQIAPDGTTEEVRVAQDRIPSVYSNVARLAHSGVDFRVVFSEVMMQPGSFDMLQVDRISVVMSPQSMKKFLLAVSEQLRKWEASYGEIALTED